MNDSTDRRPRRMACMEILGGNHTIDETLIAPGLEIFVHSLPFNESQVGGGDIYYLTSCASGRISRFLLADVSGHGEAASALAISLRDMLRRSVNKISQKQFVRDMNQRFGEMSNEQGFATAIVATFFEPRQTLAISVAGHPYPIYYRQSQNRWIYLDSHEQPSVEKENLPLGVHDESDYPGKTLQIEPGDIFLIYSDAYIEAETREGKPLGIPGLCELLNRAPDPRGSKIIPWLREEIGRMSGANLKDDDATLIIGQFTTSRVRMRDNLLAPVRLLQPVTDKTRIREESLSS